MAKIDKKKLKEFYKQNPPEKGVFMITNLLNNKKLLGISQNIPGTFNRIKSELKIGSHFLNKELLNDWQKYGEDNFKFEILEKVELNHDPQYDYLDDLKVLLALWKEKVGLCEYN